ncbi:hypothetical protein [Pseudoalteromonas rubra]|uniref:hypothetical protein n=1 Tax=Pseudoalteromonas rubra TaxID=43658 RepID=UPI001029B23A|nr:hypothetical protein [Pseudoalteromonas rubra]
MAIVLLVVLLISDNKCESYLVYGFSLKSALGSGLTAGLSAGAGHVLRRMEVFAAADKAGNAINAVNGAGKALDGVYKLSSVGKAALGATSAVSTVVANKVVGNDTSFRWGNVAASALSAYAGGKLGLGNRDSLAGGMTSGNMVFDTAGGIANSALRYGSDKLFGNEASWNFSSIVADAFVNALGGVF